MSGLPVVVVLGATGFLGRAVSRRFEEGRGHRVRRVARSRPAGGVVVADLERDEELAVAVADADVVVHLAANLSGPSSWRGGATDPVGGPAFVDRLVAVCSGPRPPVVLLAGSTTAGAPRSTYETAKADTERALARAVGRGALAGATLRLPTVYGPGPDRGVVSTMLRHALADRPLTVWACGTMRRDLLYVDDAAGAFVAAARRSGPLSGGAWDVGTGVGTPVAELAAEVARVVGDRTGRPPVPVRDVDPPDWSVPADLVDCLADTSRFRASTGWRPRTAVREGIRATLDTLVAAGVPRPLEAAAGRGGND